MTFIGEGSSSNVMGKVKFSRIMSLMILVLLYRYTIILPCGTHFPPGFEYVVCMIVGY